MRTARTKNRKACTPSSNGRFLLPGVVVVTAGATVSYQLQQWRRRRGLSVSGLARAAGLAKSTVSQLERNQGNPSLDTLWALARALNIPVSFLFTEVDGFRAPRLIRKDEAVITLAEKNYVARMLAGWNVEGEIEIYLLDLSAGCMRESEGHGAGVVEHVFSITGTIEVGVASEFVRGEPGDMITLAADHYHYYKAIDGALRAISIHEYGREGPASEPEPAK